MIDVIFLSYDEPNADENWNKLLVINPLAKRIHGINGIFNAHKRAAELSNTMLFYIIDGDTEVSNNFDFSYKPPFTLRNFTHVWKSKNPVNDLDYGYGGIKILSKKFFNTKDKNLVDITSSISDGLIIHEEVASITHFNSSPFHAWRGAFRECVKLSSHIIDKQIDTETKYRMNIWCTVGEDKPYGKYVLDGANLGKKYGEENKNNKKMLKLINDFSWLLEIFNKNYSK